MASLGRWVLYKPKSGRSVYILLQPDYRFHYTRFATAVHLEVAAFDKPENWNLTYLLLGYNVGDLALSGHQYNRMLISFGTI